MFRFVFSLFIMSFPLTAFANSDSEQEIFQKTDIGAGYNKLSNTYSPSCFKAVKISVPTEASESTLSFQHDLSEEFFRNALDVEASVSIPIEGIVTLNPKLVFSRDASVTNLSHSSTFIAYTKLGEKELSPYEENKLELKEQFLKYFDEAGELNKPYEFVLLCGDEMVSSHTLSSKLFITAKVGFKSIQDKLFFEADLGVSPAIISSWSVNAKLRDLDINLRERLRMDFYAIQIGGQPERLTGALKTSSCLLSDLEKCQDILNDLQKYVAEDYSKQLVAAKTDRWQIEHIETLPYYLNDIYDGTGKKLTFDSISDPTFLVKLNELKIESQTRAIKEQKNYKLAQMMKETPYLATDELATLNEITLISAQNIQRLNFFGNECYKNLAKCAALDKDELFAQIIIPYDATLLGVNLGELISKVYANTSAGFSLDGRVSQDFVILQPQLRESIYSSYYLKFKDINNYVIKNDAVYLNIRCHNFFWFPESLMKNAFQYYEILQPQMAINYRQKCDDQNALYVASPHGFEELLGPNNVFIVELWGRK